jgi:hypothetical protein
MIVGRGRLLQSNAKAVVAVRCGATVAVRCEGSCCGPMADGRLDYLVRSVILFGAPDLATENTLIVSLIEERADC